MLLAIDAGNTNIVFAVHDGKEMRAEWRAVTETTRTADEYAVLLVAAPVTARASVSTTSTAPSSRPSCRPRCSICGLLCRRYLKCEPLVVGDPNLDLGIEVHIDRPEAVGADRLVNTVAAHARYKGASDRRRFRHGHDLRHRQREGRLRRRRHRAGRQSLRRGAAPGRRHAAARRHPAHAIGDRQGHRSRDAVGTLLGLYRPDRRARERASRTNMASR